MSTVTLRAWEARYGLLPSARTAGGQRLYQEADVGRVQAVRRLVDRGWSVAGAVGHVLGQPGRPGEASGEPGWCEDAVMTDALARTGSSGLSAPGKTAARPAAR